MCLSTGFFSFPVEHAHFKWCLCICIKSLARSALTHGHPILHSRHGELRNRYNVCQIITTVHHVPQEKWCPRFQNIVRDNNGPLAKDIGLLEDSEICFVPGTTLVQKNHIHHHCWVNISGIAVAAHSSMAIVEACDDPWEHILAMACQNFHRMCQTSECEHVSCDHSMYSIHLH